MGGDGHDSDQALVETQTADGLVPPAGSLAGDLASLATLLQAVAETPGAADVAGELAPGPFADGGFVIEKKLGSGGMGVVYLARDTQLDRPVAIKLARTRGGSGELDRMRREATAMGRLTHPNVVRVYEVDTTGDQLFIVMEYLSGGTLRRWLREGERDLDAILDAYTAVGEGLAAAHAAGIAHRDFKPDNVFIADDGRPAVADFGLARAVGEAPPVPGSGVRTPASGSFDSRLTATGATLGTPRYMAPEQFDGGDVDARADQFSFCVALYEAVYDQHPFGGDNMAELRERVRAGVVLPGRPDRKVPAWLRKILVRGLAVDPAARFPDMRGLLDALADARTRRGAVTRYVAVGLVAAAVAGGAFVLTRGGASDPCGGAEAAMAGVWDDPVRDRAAAGFRDSGLEHAPRVWAAIAPRLDDYRSRWIDAHTRACVATRVRNERSDSALDLSMSCLERQRAQLAKLGELFATPDRDTVASASPAVDDLPDPDHCLDVDRMLGSGKKPELESPEVHMVRHQIGELRALRALGRFREAHALAEKLAARARELGDKRLLADCLYNLGLVLRLQRDEKPAVTALEEALNIAYSIGHDERVADAVAELTVLARENRADGDRWFQMGLAAIERLGGDPVQESSLRCGYVGALRQTGRQKEALEQAEKCLSLSLEHIGPTSREVVIGWENVAAAREGAGDYQGALDAAGKGLAILDQHHPGAMRLTSNLLNIMVAGELRLGKLEQGEADARRVIELRTELYGADALPVSDALSNLAAILVQRGKLDEAIERSEAALAIERKHLPDDSEELARALGNLAITYVSAGKLDRAIDLAKESLEVFQRLHPDNGHPDMVNAYTLLGTLLRYKGDNQASLASLERAVQLAGEAYPHGHPQTVNPMIELAHTLAALGEHGQAIAVLEKALVLCENPNVPPPWVAEARFALATSLRASGRSPGKAARLAREARETYAKMGQGFAGQVAEIDAWLAPPKKK